MSTELQLESQIGNLQNQLNALRSQASMTVRQNRSVGLPKIPVWLVIGGVAGAALSLAFNLSSDQALWLILGAAIAGFIFGEFFLNKIL